MLLAHGLATANYFWAPSNPIMSSYRKKNPQHSYFNQVKVLAFLIVKDADVNCKNFAGDTPMHLAAIKSFEWAVMMLLKAGGKS